MELIVSLGLGTLIVAGAVRLFSQGLRATSMVSERAEMQQDVRAASNILIKDISLAGTGLPPGGIALATGGAELPLYGCDPTKCYVGGTPPVGIVFPGGTSPYMYWIIPGDGLGPVVTSGQPATDAISVVQADTAFPWSDYRIALNSTSTTGTISLVSKPMVVASPPSPEQKVSHEAYGLKTGDLILLTGTAGGNAISAIGEVTANVTGTDSPYTVHLSSTDALRFNQSGATSNGLVQMKNLTGMSITRIWLISYYISTDSGAPTLMRKVNGQAPAPVAENIVDLQFNYDTYDDNGNPINSDAPTSPNMIRKVNLRHMTAHSAVGAVPDGFQSLDIQTSVSARNMSFKNSYQ